jgi:hypothetical protein
MSDRDIHCHKCQTYLGVIRDAKLRKDIVHVCGPCSQPPRPGPTPNFNREFTDELFGMLGRKKK